MKNVHGVILYDNPEEAEPLPVGVSLERLPAAHKFGIVETGNSIRPATEGEYRTTIGRLRGISPDEVELPSARDTCSDNQYPYCGGTCGNGICQPYHYDDGHGNKVKGCLCGHP